MIREYIRKIGELKEPEDMQKLGNMLADLIESTEDTEIYNKYKMCLYKMLYGETLTKEMAEEIVHNMKPYGEHWNFETTSNVKAQYGIQDISDVDFYITMNSRYNDNKDTVDKFIQENHKLDVYVSLAKDFILDPDGKENKVFKYFAY
jgi:hypothetical protein